MTVDVLAMRNAGHFGGMAAHWQNWEYAGTIDQALAQLDREYEFWVDRVRALGGGDLHRPCGPSEDGWADAPLARLVLHIHRELIHHGAEVACLRDLYAHSR